MGLVPIELRETEQHTERARALVVDADARLDVLLAGDMRRRLPTYAPSDPMAVFSTLCALEERIGSARFLEWGSGLGTITGLAELTNWRACGIEIDALLAEASRELLEDHGLGAEIATGSFLPEDYEIPVELLESDVMTIKEGQCGYTELGRDLDEFDVVFSYPWPGEEAVHLHLFEERAAVGTYLVTHHAMDRVRVLQLRG